MKNGKNKTYESKEWARWTNNKQMRDKTQGLRTLVDCEKKQNRFVKIDKNRDKVLENTSIDENQIAW